MGGGCIKIKKVNITHSDYLMHIINNIGNTISAKEIDIFVKNILDYDIITEKKQNLIKEQPVIMY